MFDTLKRGAVAAVAALAIAGCGGGSSNSTPSDTDLLKGAGKFEGADAQGQWSVVKVAGATVNDDPFVACPAATGLSGTCAKVTASPLGDHDYSTQLAFWDPSADPTTFKTVHLSAGKQYVVKFAGAVVSDDSASRQVSIWLQTPDYQKIVNPTPTTKELPTTGDTYESAPFAVSADVDVHVVINLGPEGANGGTTFYLDNVQVIEQAKPPPPTGTDILAGGGSFDDATSQGDWFINPPSQAGNVSLTYSACPAGGTGQCAVVSAASGYGTSSYSTQLSWGTGSFTEVTIDATKKYRVALKGMVASCSTPGNVTVAVWAQSVSVDWPPLNAGSSGHGPGADLTLTGTMTALTTDVWTPASGQTDVHFVVNLGGTGGNAGCVFTFDDIQLIEIKP